MGWKPQPKQIRATLAELSNATTEQEKSTAKAKINNLGGKALLHIPSDQRGTFATSLERDKKEAVG